MRREVDQVVPVGADAVAQHDELARRHRRRWSPPVARNSTIAASRVDRRRTTAGPPMSITTRFAPSPTGLLHLGHASVALDAWRRARAAGGRFLLRLEDIDAARCRPEFAAAILEDLQWLGLDWDGPVRVQSAHLAEYRAVLDRCGRRPALSRASAPGRTWRAR